MGLVAPAVILMVSLTAVAVKAAVRAPRNCTKRITPSIVGLARKWARQRGLPVQWVLATIKLESGGRSCLEGDQGRSIGLMQVNSAAHKKLLAEMGFSREDLFEPDVNIAVGTALLRKRWEQVHAATGGSPPMDMGTLVALAYWGPGPTLGALAAGTDPAKQNPRRVARWNAALSETAPLV